MKRQSSELTLKRGRFAMPAVVVGAKIYVVGGSTEKGLTGSIEIIHTDKGRVELIETPLLPRRWHTAQVFLGGIYVCGGVTGNENSESVTPLVERFDLKTGKVTKCAPLPTPRRTAASVLARKQIWVIGGSNQAGQYKGEMEIYDPVADAWSPGPPQPTPRECDVALFENILYAVGGYSGQAGMRTIEAYSIAQARWYPLPDLPTPLSANHMAVVSGHLYTFGDYAVLNRTMVCDLRSGRWQTTTLPYEASRHNAVAVVNGREMYVIGGNIQGNNSYLDKIQVFS